MAGTGGPSNQPTDIPDDATRNDLSTNQVAGPSGLQCGSLRCSEGQECAPSVCGEDDITSNNGLDTCKDLAGKGPAGTGATVACMITFGVVKAAYGKDTSAFNCQAKTEPAMVTGTS